MLGVLLKRFLFFFQAEDGIRDSSVTGVQTCALPIFHDQRGERAAPAGANVLESQGNGAAHKICGHDFVSLFQGALPVANYKCSFFRMRGFEKSCPCPPQAACVANAATATSIKLRSSPRRPILRALLRTSSGGTFFLALSPANHTDVVSTRPCVQ